MLERRYGGLVRFLVGKPKSSLLDRPAVPRRELSKIPGSQPKAKPKPTGKTMLGSYKNMEELRKDALASY